MLSITNVSYSFGPRSIIENCNMHISDGWKVGVIGINGAGKSTLFKLISGELIPDGGSITIAEGQKLGIVRQDIPETDTPLIDIVLAANEEMAALWKATETETDPNKIADIYQRLSDIDAYSAEGKAAALLTGLGFTDDQLREPFSSFSGGWRMRVALAAALFVEPEILLLDEPTNHLDIEAIMWLETYLMSYPHTLLIISHDREVLNKCIDHVAHVDKQQVKMYTGNYDTFELERARSLDLQQKMHEKQEAQRAHMQSFIDRFKAKASKARQAQSRVKALERMSLVDAVIADRAVRFTFPNPDKIAPPMISINKADIGYAEGKPILRRVHESIDTDDRIALLGANGNGKSTLMKLIAGKLGTLNGDVFRSKKLRIGYFSQHQAEELDMSSTPFREMLTLMQKHNPQAKEPTVRAKLGQFGFSKELSDNTISTLSGGEKARLLFALMSFDAPHLLLLDEPTNHLDIDARAALVDALNAYEGAVVIVSHDPNMVERVADRLWLVQDGKVEKFDGDLDDYRAFTIQSRREKRRAEKKSEKKADASTAMPANSNSAPAPRVNKHKLEKMEKDIARLTKEKEKLEAKMAEPDFYTRPQAMIDVQKDYAKVTEELEQYETQWLAAQA